MDSQAVLVLANAIQENMLVGGTLATLDITGNRMKECTHHPVAEYAHTLDDQLTCDQCTSALYVEKLVDAVWKHPRLISLCGLRPTETSLFLSAQTVDGMMARVLAAELRFNHTVTEVDISLNTIGKIGTGALAHAIRDNVCLRYLKTPSKFESELHHIARAKMAAFKYRVALALFMRGHSYLSAAPLRIILEYSIGLGPQVTRYLKYTDDFC
jgi:hypothetical protein